jgi:hypothetical protein
MAVGLTSHGFQPNIAVRITWLSAKRGALGQKVSRVGQQHMDVSIAWLSASHGCQHHMVVSTTWQSSSSGKQQHIAGSITWLSATHSREQYAQQSNENMSAMFDSSVMQNISYFFKKGICKTSQKR